MTHFDSESVPFDNCPKVVLMIGAQIMAVVQNRIPQASTFCYVLFCLHGTCTMLYFVLTDKTCAVPLMFYSLGHKSCDNI